jgi:signal peptidase II
MHSLIRTLKLGIAIIAFFLIDIFFKNFIFTWLIKATGATNKVDYLVYPLFGETVGFNFVVAYNKGVSFSMLSNLYWARSIIIIISLLIILFFLYELIKSENKIKSFGLILIVGGALGNLYDRIFLGAVRDFIDFFILDYHWPAFNLADSFVCLGGFLFIYSQIFNKKKSKK